MLETVEPLARKYRTALATVEFISVTVFSVEYLLRLWSCTADPRFRHPVLGRIRFALQPLTLIDLLSILPAYLPAAAIDLRFLRVLRLMRILRVLKLGHYSEAVGVLADVLRSRRAELIVMLMMLAILLVLSSGMIYYAEHEAQPEAFGSMPAALWWSVITLTTIGYGDVYPVTRRRPRHRRPDRRRRHRHRRTADGDRRHRLRRGGPQAQGKGRPLPALRQDAIRLT